MAKYTIYTIEGGEPTDVKAVQDGWNMSALKYGIFWCIYKKLWLYFFLITIMFIVLLIYVGDSITLFSFLSWWLLIHFVLSYQGNDLLGAKLIKDFYKEAYVEPIEADSEDEAVKKYIREQALAEQFEEKEDEIIDGEVIQDDWFTSLIVDFGIYLLPVLTVGGIILLSKLFAFN